VRLNACRPGRGGRCGAAAASGPGRDRQRGAGRLV